MHWVRVLKTESVDIVGLSKMTLHPLNTKVVGDLGSEMHVLPYILSSLLYVIHDFNP